MTTIYVKEGALGPNSPHSSSIYAFITLTFLQDMILWPYPRDMFLKTP